MFANFLSVSATLKVKLSGVDEAVIFHTTLWTDGLVLVFMTDKTAALVAFEPSSGTTVGAARVRTVDDYLTTYTVPVKSLV